MIDGALTPEQWHALKPTFAGTMFNFLYGFDEFGLPPNLQSF